MIWASSILWYTSPSVPQSLWTPDVSRLQADFCNPGLLGLWWLLTFFCWWRLIFSQDNYTTFRRVYEVPILKSRAPDCSTKEMLVGEARSAQVNSFRRITFRLETHYVPYSCLPLRRASFSAEMPTFWRIIFRQNVRDDWPSLFLHIITAYHRWICGFCNPYISPAVYLRQDPASRQVGLCYTGVDRGISGSDQPAYKNQQQSDFAQSDRR